MCTWFQMFPTMFKLVNATTLRQGSRQNWLNLTQIKPKKLSNHPIVYDLKQLSDIISDSVWRQENVCLNASFMLCLSAPNIQLTWPNATRKLMLASSGIHQGSVCVSVRLKFRTTPGELSSLLTRHSASLSSFSVRKTSLFWAWHVQTALHKSIPVLPPQTQHKNCPASP